MTPDPYLSRLLDLVVEHIDIPRSYYEKAADRHRSLGKWLCRESSAVRHFEPDVRPQGSFRFGTVIRPLNEDAEYDLDNVCMLTTLGKLQLTQRQLKEMYGREILAYAREHGMLAPVEEHNRCWRLRYADEVAFHLDTLPCVPEEHSVVVGLIEAGVSEELARRIIAITDRRHRLYDQLTLAWPNSNPRGFSHFFEQQAARGLARSHRAGELRAAVEDVPPYEWKTPLQRAIQVLKRHRDVMFEENPDLAPISMIITNLAAQAYQGETDVAAALVNIIDRMPLLVQAERPRVPNPADPEEDYADKWSKDPRLEKNFWLWLSAIQADLTRLTDVLRSPGGLEREVEVIFRVTFTRDEMRSFGGDSDTKPIAVIRSAPCLVIPTACKPWGRHG